jgi:hypothetical protein
MPPPDRNTRATAAARLGLAVLLAALPAAAFTIARLERPAAPPILRPDRWDDWWRSAGPLDAVAGIARLLAIAGLAYLGLVLLAAVWSERRPLPPSGWARLAPAWLRAPVAVVVTTAVGPGAAGPALAISDPGVAVPPDPPSLAAVDEGGDPAHPRTSLPWAAEPDLDPPPAEPPGDLPPLPARPAHDPTAPPAGSGGGPPGSAVGTVVVQPGDHLWGLAAQALARDLGRAPAETEIAPYWRTVVAANRDRLVDPDNPDLILPGQEMVLPPR